MLKSLFVLNWFCVDITEISLYLFQSLLREFIEIKHIVLYRMCFLCIMFKICIFVTKALYVYPYTIGISETGSAKNG